MKHFLIVATGIFLLTSGVSAQTEPCIYPQTTNTTCNGDNHCTYAGPVSTGVHGFCVDKNFSYRGATRGGFSGFMNAIKNLFTAPAIRPLTQRPVPSVPQETAIAPSYSAPSVRPTSQQKQENCECGVCPENKTNEEKGNGANSAGGWVPSKEMCDECRADGTCNPALRC